MTTRVLEIDGAVNFRDMGGYEAANGKHVRWKKIFRSGRLSELSDGGAAAVAQLGLGAIFDLRFPTEARQSPTHAALFEQAKVVQWAETDRENIPANQLLSNWRDSVKSNDVTLVRDTMRENYPKKLYSHADIYRQMIMHLANEDSPILFHCSAGKDRTGVGAAILLSLLGVSRDQIMQDYLLTQSILSGHVARWMAGGATSFERDDDFQDLLANTSLDVIKPVFDADESYLQRLFEYVDDEFDGFQNYVTSQLKIDDQVVRALSDNLLE